MSNKEKLTYQKPIPLEQLPHTPKETGLLIKDFKKNKGKTVSRDVTIKGLGSGKLIMRDNNAGKGIVFIPDSNKAYNQQTMSRLNTAQTVANLPMMISPLIGVGKGLHKIGNQKGWFSGKGNTRPYPFGNEGNVVNLTKANNQPVSNNLKSLGSNVTGTLSGPNDKAVRFNPAELQSMGINQPMASTLKINPDKPSPLVEQLSSNRQMINPNRPLSSTLQQQLGERNNAIEKAKANFEKWDAYAKEVKAGGGKLRGSESMGLSGSKRKLQDITSSPLQAVVTKWFGLMGEKGYGVVGTKGVPGGKPEKGSGEHQHHYHTSREMFNMAEQTAMKVDLGFRVNTQQYLASKGILPGWGKANMVNIRAHEHLRELHPMLRSMGFEKFWKDILKADPTLAEKDPNKFYDLIDQWHENIAEPSIKMANDAAMKGNTKQFVINKNELILPPTIRRQMENKTKSILDQAKQSYIDDLNRDANKKSLFIGSQNPRQRL